MPLDNGVKAAGSGHGDCVAFGDEIANVPAY